MRYATISLIALTSATLGLAGCGWVGPRASAQQSNNSCCPNCPCCQNGHRGVVANQDRPDNRPDGGGAGRDKHSDRSSDDDQRGPANRAPRNEERQIRKVIVQGGVPGMHGSQGPIMQFNPQVFSGTFLADEDEDVTVDVQVEVEPGEWDVGFAPGPRLGVGIGELDDATRETLGVEGGGIIINQVFPGSAAQKAGLQQGDVIVAIEDGEVNDLAAFVELIRSRRAGHPVSIQVLRAGADEPVTIDVTPEDGPPSGGHGMSMPFPMNLPPSAMKDLQERLQGMEPALQARIQEELRARVPNGLGHANLPSRAGVRALTVPGVPLPPHVAARQATCRAICLDGDLRIEVESDSDDPNLDVEITSGDDQVFEGEVDPAGHLSEMPEEFRARVRKLIEQIQRARH